MLTEAALAGKTDHLIGLKENVILGHLIPAGTGFRAYQEAECAQVGCEHDLDDFTSLDSLAPDEEEDFALLKDSPLEALLNEAEESRTQE